LWSAPHCRSGGLACGCEFDSSSGVKLAAERNKQSGATAAPVERICRSCQSSRPLHEPRAEPGPDWFSPDIFSRDIYGKDLVMARFRDAVLARASGHIIYRIMALQLPATRSSSLPDWQVSRQTIGSLFMVASCASRLFFSVAAVLTTIAILPDNREVTDRTAMRRESGTGTPFPGPGQPTLRNFR
jgi:hypothetical protein